MLVDANKKRTKMTAFTALKLTATKKPTQVPQILQRRLKLSKRLWEQIELAKVKYAVELNTGNDLVSTLQVIKTSVESGELDDAIESAANKLRSGFQK